MPDLSNESSEGKSAQPVVRAVLPAAKAWRPSTLRWALGGKMKRYLLILVLGLWPFCSQAAPKYVEVNVNQLPPHIKVETSRLIDNWYGFTVKVDLKGAPSSISSWSADLVLKNDKNNYLLTTQIIPSPTFRDSQGQFLSASPDHPAEFVQFWSTVDKEILKMARVELRDDDNMIVYVINLSSSPGVK